MIEAYPLCWPIGYERKSEQRKSRFKGTLGAARDFVQAEIERMKATDLIISTNIPLKQNGELYADWQRYRIDDHGVAIYFTINGEQKSLCCDTYKSIWENMYAIGRAIDALRMIDRDGVSEFLKRAFTGFKAIEGPGANNQWVILGIEQTNDKEGIKQAYYRQAKAWQADGKQLTDLNLAREQADKYADSNK